MRSTIVRVFLRGVGLVMLVCATAGSAFAAGPAVVPEIDGGTIATGLAGLSAAVLILRARRRSQ